jgi:hypothetical protein
VKRVPSFKLQTSCTSLVSGIINLKTSPGRQLGCWREHQGKLSKNYFQ